MAGAAGCLLAALASGCGLPDQTSPSIVSGAHLAPQQRASAPATTVPLLPSRLPTTLYFISADSSHLVAAKQFDAHTGLAAAIGSLLAGPTSSESAAGLSTAIPDKTKLDSSSLHGPLAYLDFSKSLASVSGQEQLLAFAQIVVTATSVPGVQEVLIAVGKQVVSAPLSDGTLAQGPVGRASYASLIQSGS